MFNNTITLFWVCSTTQTYSYKYLTIVFKTEFRHFHRLVSLIVFVFIFVILSVDIIVLLSILLFLLSPFCNRCRHSRCGFHRTTIYEYQPATAFVYQRCNSSINHQMKSDFRIHLILVKIYNIMVVYFFSFVWILRSGIQKRKNSSFYYT